MANQLPLLARRRQHLNVGEFVVQEVGRPLAIERPLSKPAAESETGQNLK